MDSSTDQRASSETSVDQATSPPTRRAVIDVGTNSVKILIAEISGHEIRPLLEDSEQTRLGRGFYETRRLQPDAIAATAAAVARYALLANSWRASHTRVVATSAARDAVNPSDLTTAILEASGLPVEIITGEQEASWVFQGICTDARLAGQPLLIVDVGGGSTEFILGRDREEFFRQSFPLGTVRLLEKLPVSDPPQAGELVAARLWIREFLAREIAPRLRSATNRFPAEHLQLVATGGTPAIMAQIHLRMNSYDRDRIDSTRLDLHGVRDQVNQLWAAALADRRLTPGLPSSRADVILMGTAIIEGIMDQFGLAQLRPSTRGLRYAALLPDMRR